jgi:hypothetical protein
LAGPCSCCGIAETGLAESIARASNGRYSLGTQQFSKLGHVNGEVVFLRYHAMPDLEQQFLFGDDAVPVFHRGRQQVKRARTELHPLSPFEQKALGGTNFKVAKKQWVQHEKT